MTTAIGHDHPDWIRSVASADIEVLVTTVTQTVGVVNRGRFPVGNLPYLFVNFQSGAQAARLILSFYTAQSGGTFINSKPIHVPAGGSASGAVASAGPWVEVETSLNAAPSDITIRLFQTLEPTTDDDLDSLISLDGTVVAAFGANTTDATQVRWGWAHWSAAFHNSGLSLIRLYYVDFTGTQRLLAITGNDVIQRSGLILLPAFPVRLFSQNGDGVARNLHASVRVHYGPF